MPLSNVALLALRLGFVRASWGWKCNDFDAVHSTLSVFAAASVTLMSREELFQGYFMVADRCRSARCGDFVPAISQNRHRWLGHWRGYRLDGVCSGFPDLPKRAEGILEEDPERHAVHRVD